MRDRKEIGEFDYYTELNSNAGEPIPTICSKCDLENGYNYDGYCEYCGEFLEPKPKENNDATTTTNK